MRIKAVALLAALGVAGTASAQIADEAPPPELAADIAAATAAAQAGGTGPMRAVMLSDPGLPTHTLYRPE